MARALIRQHWTPEDDAELIAVVGQGKSFRAIATQLRRTENAIRHRAKLIVGRSCGSARQAKPRRPCVFSVLDNFTLGTGTVSAVEIRKRDDEVERLQAYSRYWEIERLQAEIKRLQEAP